MSKNEQNKELGQQDAAQVSTTPQYLPIEYGSELSTRICFAVGGLDRDQLEDTASDAGVDYDKWTTSDDLRADVIEAAHERGGITIYADEGELKLGFATSELGQPAAEMNC